MRVKSKREVEHKIWKAWGIGRWQKHFGVEWHKNFGVWSAKNNLGAGWQTTFMGECQKGFDGGWQKGFCSHRKRRRKLLPLCAHL